MEKVKKRQHQRMKKNSKITLIAFLYLLCCVIYIAFAHSSDFWSVFYYTKDNLFVVLIALFLRRYIKYKIIPDFLVLVKLFSTISITLRLFFNCRIAQDYSAIFLMILSIPLIIQEWRQVIANKK